MNLDQAVERIKVLEGENEKLAKQVKDQNSYITKLEANKGGNDGVHADPAVTAYLKRKMREDVTAAAVQNILQVVQSKEVYEAIRPDFEAFLDKNMKEANTTEAYIIDAFNLVWGRAMANKDHPVHSVGKAQTPSGTPSEQTPVNAAGKNTDQITQVQKTLQASSPSPINDNDGGGGNPPDQGKPPVKTTKDAMKNLRARFQQHGGNRFS